MRRPRIKSPCVADGYANRDSERIAEFSGDAGGGLFMVADRGDALHLSLYSLSGCVVHVDPAALSPESLRAAARLFKERGGEG